ncbi:hypothetical protein SISSUDRAFT_1049290 [Sistotremastrum suecicum HHB10207 ss-3]|uniref:MYND-type domain-containing protein n=1 Tax=Sistotremastrum suecicum HHB10207 ss-3 TaxID=1314776 RepID=A0A166BY63_9AGAM|nr:hypothetical protein SISSUDRAFT_1049290 [Sistotremastrum suecicum HHB10207 ss-3]
MAPDSARDELLGTLLSMGVECLGNTKVSDAELSDRLSKALDCSQLLSPSSVSGSPLLNLDPASLSPWDDQPLRKKLGPETPQESLESLCRSPGPCQYEDAFKTLRETIAFMSDVWESEAKMVVVEDEAKSAQIVIRVHDVVKLNSNTPVVVVLYKHVLLDQDTPAGQERSDHEIVSALISKQSSLRYRASLQEQRLLLRLLDLNSPRLSPSYRPRRRACEGHHERSFLLPLHPLSIGDVNHLSREPGCPRCGDRNAKTCTFCDYGQYCSPVCQSGEKAPHKLFCRPVAFGTWQIFTFHPLPVLGLSYLSVSALTAIDDEAIPFDDYFKPTTQEPPSNIYSDRPFMARIEGNSVSVRVYDRLITCDFYMFRDQDAKSYMDLCKATGMGWQGMWCYRWVKRVSDWQLAICVDVLPEMDPSW